MSPRSTENSATRLIELSWRAARPADAHVCQYVVITTSTATSAERDVREANDLPVHRGVFARFETSRSRASRMKFATMLVPP